MPAMQPYLLVKTILEAIQESGYSAILTSPLRVHPRKFIISPPEGPPISLWAYIWTLTHGGRPSLPHEYRIQMTTVSSPLDLNPLGFTALLGYEPDLGMLAGFDLNQHQFFTTGSPSVQIDIRVIRQALQDGMAFDLKDNAEVAVGIRPDQLMAYVQNADSLHKSGARDQVFRLLTKASSLQEIPEEAVASLSADRKRIVLTVSRLSRQANFRQQVLRAYGYRCAVTGIQLKLIDAAHILPVGAPASTDDVQNGIALSPTYHRAFDSGLIYLDEGYTMRVNAAKESALVTLNLEGGLEGFKAPLGHILLPPDRKQWPSVALVRKANRFRMNAG